MRRSLCSAGFVPRVLARALPAGLLPLVALTTVALAPGRALAAPSVSWTQMNGSANGCTDACPSSPPPRAAYAMAYDPATKQLVLFGGLDASGDNLNDTWTWNGTTWTQVDDSTDPGCTTTCTSSPPPRAASYMAYDPATQQLILFGGNGNAGYLNDTWTWNGTTWTELFPATPPAGDSGFVMAYDQASQQFIYFSGLNGNDQTWSWDGTTWTELSPATSPPFSVAPDLVYDAANHQLLLFAGEDYEGNATWSWNGTTWTQVNDSADPGCGNSNANPCPSSPSVRNGAGMDFDPASGQFVLFGGLGYNYYTNFNDTWTWNGTTWTQVDDSTDPGCGNGSVNPCPSGPPERSTSRLVYDPSTDQLVLFGGQGGQTPGGPVLNDTWVTQLAGVAPPPNSPTGLTATNQGNTIVVNWNSSSGANCYDVYRYTQGTAATLIATVCPSGSGSSSRTANARSAQTASPSDPSYTDTNVSCGVAYSYYVTATNSIGPSGPSNTASASVPCGTGTTASQGYWLAGSDGGIFSFGNVSYHGSVPGDGIHVNNVVGMAPTHDSGGYWLAGSDGGVFTFGDATYHGSVPGDGIHINNVRGIASTADGGGYYMVGTDGGVFTFGDAALPRLGPGTRHPRGQHHRDPSDPRRWRLLDRGIRRRCLHLR